ncbi:MAG: hypothetical protein JW704_11285 [Anaerolineaceae bacterium]|nr:hypothetical protein [Anaerolineaceae bacterium]
MGRYLNTDRSPRAQEDRVAQRTGGKRVRGSGASQYSKGDVRDVEAAGIDFLLECKQTIHASLSIKWEWLKKITAEADAQQCEPALAIEIRGGEDDPRTDRDWVMVPARVWEKMKCQGE